MKVFCKYNKEFDSFLKKTVRYTIDRYGQYLDVTDIEEIELQDINDFLYETDGKTLGLQMEGDTVSFMELFGR